MTKHTEKLKKQLIEISEVVNLFKSEAVQVRVVDRLLDAMIESERSELEVLDALNKKRTKQRTDDAAPHHYTSGRKKLGATKILNQLLVTDFFDTTRSISDVAEYCRNQFNADFKTSELSGILLKLANENKLRRERSLNNNRFEYIKA